MFHSTNPSGLESATHLVDREAAAWASLPPDLSLPSHKKIDYASLQRKEKLGAGAAGTVYKAVWLGADVAEKTFVGSDDLSFQREVSVLAGLSHPNITTFLAYAVDREYCSIVTELMDGDLSSLMHNRRRRNKTLDAPFPISEAVGLIDQIAEGVNYLHDHRVVHRDLKASNVLVKCEKASEVGDESVNCKLSDFGLSKTKESSHTYSNQAPNTGSTRWMAPELYGGNLVPDIDLKYPFKSDVYSFGMLCYEILTGKMPFSDTSSLPEVRKKVASGRRPTLPAQCPQELCSLVESCWKQDASARPCFADILADLKCLKRSLPTGRLKRCVDGHTARSSEDSRRGVIDRPSHEKTLEIRDVDDVCIGSEADMDLAVPDFRYHMSEIYQQTQSHRTQNKSLPWTASCTTRRVDRKTKQRLEVKNEVYQLVGFFSVFQSLLLTASAQSSFLQWHVVSLSALGALVTLCGVLEKFRRVWKLERIVASERLLRQYSV